VRPRIRSVKPEIYLDEELWALGVETGFPIYQGFQGLWSYADREKRFAWRPAALKALILPYWDGDMGALLDALARAGFIAKYTVDGRHYGLVVNLDKHQCFNAREPPSELPPPPPGTPGTRAHVHARAEHGWSGSGIGIGDGIGNGSGGGIVDDDEGELALELAEPEAEPAAAEPPKRRRARVAEPTAAPGEWLQYPAGWKWSAATAAAAAAKGVTPAELQETVNYWTIHKWRSPATDLDAELVHRLDGILKHRAKNGGGSAAGPPATNAYRWAPTDEHRSFAKKHALPPLAHAVEAYRAGGVPDKLGTLRANDDFLRRLEAWVATGEFVAKGPVPKHRARGAA
jgi:hypothetical protein